MSLSSQEAYFIANLRGLPVSCSKRFVAETVSRAISAAAVMKISLAPFCGRLFSRAKQPTLGEAETTGGVISTLAFGGDRLGAAKQLRLASPKLCQEEHRTEGADEKGKCHASGGHP